MEFWRVAKDISVTYLTFYLVNLLFEENRKKAMNDVGNKCFFSLYFSQEILLYSECIHFNILHCFL